MSKKGPSLDRKSELTFKTIENLKGSSNVFNEFVKAASNYQKQAIKLAEAGKFLADSLNKIAQLQNGDVGEGIMRLAETCRQVENKREVLANSIQNDLITAVQRSIKPDENEAIQFENEYKKARANMRTQLKKLEDQSKKAGKKGGPSLMNSISALNDKIKEGDQIKAEKLRNALLLERKKFCNFLIQWKPIINLQIDLHSGEGGKFQQQSSYWENLANSSNQLPPDLEDLITSTNQERTLISIQNDGTSSNYNYSSGFDDDYGYDGSSSSSNLTGGSSSYTVSALYDYQGQQPEDLSFSAGDVITVINDDDGSGWMEGELRGKRGIFPTSYVQYN